MRLHYTERFRRSYAEAPFPIRRAFDKQAAHLVLNLRHPSLKAKKYDEARDILQARVTKDWRCYFTIEGDTYHLIELSRIRNNSLTGSIFSPNKKLALVRQSFVSPLRL